MQREQGEGEPERFYFNFDDKRIRFPGNKEPYQLQIRMMKMIIQAINKKKSLMVQSPTGTGKTFCLLSSTLEALKQSQKKGIKKIYYLTRTHSQMQSIIKQIKSTDYQPTYTFLQTRKTLCVHQQLVKMVQHQENVDVELFQKLCQQARSITLQSRQIIQKRCCLKTNLSLKPENVFKQKVSFFPFYQISSQDDFKQYAKNHNYCPYYYSTALQQESQLAIMSYMYLLNPFILDIKKFDLTDSIIIIDQAHNVLDVAKQQYSSKILDKNIEQTKKQLSTVQSLNLNIENPQHVIFGNIILSFATYFNELEIFFQKTKNHFEQNNPNKKPKIMYLSEFNRIVKSQNIFNGIVQFKYDNESDLGEFLLFIFKQLKIQKSKINGALKIIYKLNFILKNPDNQKKYVVVLYQEKSKKKQQKQFKIKFHCISPQLAFNRLKKCKTIILASGTIKKQQFNDTGLDFLNYFCLELPRQSIYKKDNIQRYEITYVDKKPLYITSNCPNYQEVAYYLNFCTRFIPHGVLVFFKSKNYLNEFKQYIQKQNKNQMGGKKIFYEQKNGKNFICDYEDYKKECSSEKGAIFFGYMRGKISQGCNFNDHLARAVFIVGLPLAALGSIEVKIEKYVSKSQSDFQRWYYSNAMKAVNQAVGRILRHKDDFGLVFLLGKLLHKNRDMLPSWLQLFPFKINQEYIPLKERIKKFFRTNPSIIIEQNNNLKYLQQQNIVEQQDSQSIIQQDLEQMLLQEYQSFEYQQQ